MSSQALVPAIRFKDFTEPWEQRQLGEIGVVIDPHPSHRAPKEEPGGIPFIGIGDVDEMGNIDRDTARPVSELVFEEHHKRYDLAIPSLGLGRVASLGKVIRLRDDIGKYAVSPTMSVLQFKIDYDVDYLYAFMRSAMFQKQFESRSNGSTRQSVGTETVRILDLSLPAQKSEQKQIGTFYKALDSFITLHKRKLDKIKRLKKALLEKMFAAEGEKKPKIRFKGFTDPWEQRKLGSLMEVTSVKRVHQSDWTGSGIRFLRARDLVAFLSGEDVEDKLFISEETYNALSAISGKVSIGDLLVTGVGTIGIPFLIKDMRPVYFKDGNIIWFKNENKIHGEFLFYSFLGRTIKAFIRDSAGIGTVGTYTIESGKKTPISIPKRNEESVKISKLLGNVDSLITLHQRKLEKLKNIKQSLLEKMFVS